MKANEFVKEHGLSNSKLFGNGWITFDEGCIENSVDREEVKRLVESHELVDKLGGIDAAYDEAGSYYTNESRMIEISQATSDVESCQ